MQTIVTAETLDAALATVKADKGTLYVPTSIRFIKIDSRCLAAWATVPGKPLLRSEGEGFRLRTGNGKGSVYLFPGQLVLTEHA